MQHDSGTGFMLCQLGLGLASYFLSCRAGRGHIRRCLIGHDRCGRTGAGARYSPAGLPRASPTGDGVTGLRPPLLLSPTGAGGAVGA